MSQLNVRNFFLVPDAGISIPLVVDEELVDSKLVRGSQLLLVRAREWTNKPHGSSVIGIEHVEVNLNILGVVRTPFLVSASVLVEVFGDSDIEEDLCFKLIVLRINTSPFVTDLVVLLMSGNDDSSLLVGPLGDFSAEDGVSRFPVETFTREESGVLV